MTTPQVPSTENARVAVAVRQDTNFARDILRGIRDFSVGARPNWTFYLQSSYGIGQLAQLGDWRGDGIIVQRLDRRSVEELKAAGLAVVTVGSWLHPSPAAQAITDNQAVGREAAEHFLERGILNAAYCGPPRHDGSAERRQGLVATMAQHGGRFASVFETGRQGEEVRTDLTDWLLNLPIPIGVLCFTDVDAMELLAAAKRAGLRVPDDVAIIGVNDDDVICEFVRPTLTSIDLNARRIGYEAAALLDRVMAAGRGAPRPETVLIPPIGPIIRGSTDVLAIDDELVTRGIRLIWKHADEPIPLAEMLSELPASRRSLERRFQAAIGRGPAEELRRFRLEKARRLLIGSDLPVVEVAVRCGLKHQSHLNRLIREKWQMTPLDLRAAHRSPDSTRRTASHNARAGS